VTLSTAAVETLLGQVLAARRDGTLGELAARHPRLERWLVRRYLAPLLDAGVAAAGGEHAQAIALEVLLRWTAARLRPDRADADAPVPASAWLEPGAWRPLLAVLAHFGLEAVPDFPRRYRRHADDSAASTLAGLWGIGASSFYRSLQRGRDRFAQVLQAWPPDVRAMLSLRRAAAARAAAILRARGVRDVPGWHREQAELALARGAPLAAIWHSAHAGDARTFARTLRMARIELARSAEPTELARELLGRELPTRARFEVHLALAAFHLVRKEDARASRLYGDALRLAERASDRLLVGIACRELGKFHESRDGHKALAYHRDAVDILRDVHAAAGVAGAHETAAEYLTALTLLAWMYLLQSDPRARVMLESADELARRDDVPLAPRARLELAWAEYWRREHRPQASLERYYRASSLYERLGDAREVLSMDNNLCLLHVELGDFDRAREHARRVVAANDSAPVDSYLLASAHGNLGVVAFMQEDYDRAIAHYAESLEISERCGHPLLANRQCFNLAEAYFVRFRCTRDPQDERLGDQYVARGQARAVGEQAIPVRMVLPTLKETILGEVDNLYDRMYGTEASEHADEMAAVGRHRLQLSLPGSASGHARARLGIARAHLAIFSKERDAALALVEAHGLGEELGPELDELQSALARAPAAQQLALQAHWRRHARDLLTPARIDAVLRALLDAGSIGKSGYATLCGVGPATASKHLVGLAQRGLLKQVGKSRSTRYLLP